MFKEKHEYICEKCGLKFNDRERAVAHGNLPMSSIKLKVHGMYGCMLEDGSGYAYVYKEEKGAISFDPIKKEHIRTYFACFFDNYEFIPYPLRFSKATNFTELSEKEFKGLIKKLRSIGDIGERLKNRLNEILLIKLEEIVRGEII